MTDDCQRKIVEKQGIVWNAKCEQKISDFRNDGSVKPSLNDIKNWKL